MFHIPGFLAVGVVAICFAGSAWAQDAEAERKCRRSSTAFEERVVACNSLLNNSEFEDKIWAWERLGDAYNDADQEEASLEYYNQALELDPDYPAALQGRAFALFYLDRDEEALLNTTHLIGVDPDEDWNFYFHGRILLRQERYEEAVVALNQAVELRGDYFHSRKERADALSELGRHEDARADLLAAQELRPFSSRNYRNLGSNASALGMNVQSAGYWLLSKIITRGKRDEDFHLDLLVTVATEISPPSSVYTPPENGLKIRFMQVFMPRDERSSMEEMELAIMALADWFAAPPAIKPDAMAIITRELHTGEGDAVGMTLALEAEQNMKEVVPDGKLPEFVSTYRGLFLTEYQTGLDGGPTFRVSYESADPATIWPLATGNEVVGTGSFMVVCPEEFSMPAMLAGCRPGMETATLGQLEFGILVERAEQIHVPLGVFDTWVIRHRELASMEAMGRRIERQVETRWWYAPDLNFWVKRTSQRGEKIAEIYAWEIVEAQ